MSPGLISAILSFHVALPLSRQSDDVMLPPEEELGLGGSNSPAASAAFHRMMILNALKRLSKIYMQDLAARDLARVQRGGVRAVLIDHPPGPPVGAVPRSR